MYDLAANKGKLDRMVLQHLFEDPNGGFAELAGTIDMMVTTRLPAKPPGGDRHTMTWTVFQFDDKR